MAGAAALFFGRDERGKDESCQRLRSPAWNWTVGPASQMAQCFETCDPAIELSIAVTAWQRLCSPQRRAHTLLEERNAISTFLAGCLARVSLDTFMQEICRQIGVEYRKGTAHVRRRLHDRGLIDGTSFNRIERVLDYGNKFVHNKTTKDHDAAQLVAEVDDIIAGLGVKVSAQMLIAPKSEEDLRRCEHHIDYMKQMIRERRRRMWRAKNKV